jgi:TolB-like protein/Tfp pilus assembly protein PilF
MDRPFPAYKGDEPFIFVSYAHANAEKIYGELESLHDQGFNVWYDDGISPGQSWRQELADAIDHASMLVYFVTPESGASANCHKEVNFALDANKPVLVVHLQPTELPSAMRLSLGDIQAILKHQLSEEVYRDKLHTGVNDCLRLGVSAPRAVSPKRPDKVITPQRTGFVLIVIAAIALGFVFRPTFDAESPTRSSKPTAVESNVAIAVLPFANRTSEPDYFTDGISEEILNALVKTNSVRVIARTSSFMFKDAELSVQEIAEALGASHVIEGSVSKVGHQVRVSAQLVHGSSGAPIWSERFDRDLDDIFALQDAIANAIVRDMQTTIEDEIITFDELAPRLSKVTTSAYDSFLQAQQLLQRPGPQGPESAIELFREAVAQEPEFADAWVGLGYAQWLATGIPAKKAPLVKESLQAALALEPDNARALALLGMITARVEYHWEDGLALLRRAEQLAPHDAEVQALYTWHLGSIKHPWAAEASRRVYRLNPLSPAIVSDYAKSLQATGRQIDALNVMKRFLASRGAQEPSLQVTSLLVETRQYDLAVEHLESAKSVWGSDHPEVRILEYRLAMAKGDQALARSIEQELLLKMETEYVNPFMWGSRDSLVARYRTGYQQRETQLVYGALGGKPAPFSNAEWQQLKQSMNIDELGDVPPTHRTRSKEEREVLLAKEVPLDTSMLDSYAGAYQTERRTIGFSRKGEEMWLWVGRQGGPTVRVIAMGERRFEMLPQKGYTYEFIEPGAKEFDLESTDGQIVHHWRRVEN